MSDCIFCKIVAKQIPSACIYEDEYTLAFLDIEPVFKGHSLIIPKEHHSVLAELPSALLNPFFSIVQQVSKAMESGLRAAGSFIAFNTHVGQMVPHVHAHVIPRHEQDGFQGLFGPKHPYGSFEEKESFRKHLADALLVRK